MDVGLLLILASLERQDCHIVRRGFGSDGARARRVRRVGRRDGCGRVADDDHFGFEVPQAEPLDVGETTIGVDLQLRRDQAVRRHPFGLLRRISQPRRDLQGFAERRGSLGRLDRLDPPTQRGPVRGIVRHHPSPIRERHDHRQIIATKVIDDLPSLHLGPIEPGRLDVGGAHARRVVDRQDEPRPLIRRPLNSRPEQSEHDQTHRQ